MSDICLSIALLTCNRLHSLARCLESLRAQTIQPFEVVVSDDSEPDLAFEIEKIARQWNCRYIRGPRRGLYANRNQAALVCTGTHIRTMDDDHILPKGHIEQCLKAVYADPFSIWTTGEIDFVNGKYFIKSETAGQLTPSGVAGPIKDPNDNWAIADGSTIYPRDVFRRGYMMVEDYNFGSTYLEFGAFLYQRGFRSRCILGAFIEHHTNETSLRRKTDTDVLESRLYASLCFNLYFKPNLFLASRYTCSYLLKSHLAPQLILSLPKIIYKTKKRWHPDPGHEF